MFSAYQWSDILLLGIMTGATASAPFCKIKSWSQVAPMFLFTLWPTWMMGSLLKVWQSPKDPHKSIHLGRLSAKIKSSDQTELHKKRWSRSLLMPWRLPFCHLWLLTFFFLFSIGNAHSWGPCVFFWAWFEGADRCARPWLSHWSISDLFWGKQSASHHRKHENHHVLNTEVAF